MTMSLGRPEIHHVFHGSQLEADIEMCLHRIFSQNPGLLLLYGLSHSQ